MKTAPSRKISFDQEEGDTPITSIGKIKIMKDVDIPRGMGRRPTDFILALRLLDVLDCIDHPDENTQPNSVRSTVAKAAKRDKVLIGRTFTVRQITDDQGKTIMRVWRTK